MNASTRPLRATGRPRRSSTTYVLIAIAVIGGLTLLSIMLHTGPVLFLFILAVSVLGAVGGLAAGLTGAALAIVAVWLVVPAPGTQSASPDTYRLLLGMFALLVLTAGLGFGYARKIDRERREAEQTKRHLAAIVQFSDDAIISKDLDGIILSWNAGAQRLYGYTPEEAIGRHVSMLAPPESSDEIPAIMARLRRGELIERYESTRIRRDGTRFDVSLTISPMRDASGKIIGASTIARDITDRKHFERSQQFFAEASEVLSRSLDVHATLGALARLVVSSLADWCIVDMAAEDGGTLEPIIVAHRDPTKEAIIRALREGYPGVPNAAAQVVASGESIRVPELTDAMIVATVQDPEYHAAIRSLGARSVMIVPLHANDRVLGAITFVSAESGRRYGTDDQAIAEELARRAILAVENSRLHEAEQAARISAERTAQRIERLHAVSTALSEALTLDRVTEVVVDQSMQALGAGAGALSLLSGDGTSLELVRAVGYPEDLVRRWHRYSPGQIDQIDVAMRTGQVVWYESRDAVRDRFSTDEALPGAFRHGARAAVPLMLRGAAMGVLYFNFGQSRRFDAGETEFMLTLGHQCAQAIERARLYAHAHHIAGTLQLALLPAEVPQAPGMRIDAAYIAATPEAEVGGDWYDAFRLPDGRLAVAIGDVVGRGVEAAVIMGQMRQAIRVAAVEGHDPATVLALVSRVLQLSHKHGGMTTAIFGVIDPISRTFTYATAGHPAPIFAAEGHAHTLPSSGMPLGFMERDAAPSWSVDLPPGSRLVLYTDGLIEFDRDPSTGLAVLLRAVEEELRDPAPRPAHSILHRVVAEGSRDDIAIITVALDPVSIDRLDVAFPADPSSLRLVRHALVQLARGLEMDEQQTLDLTVAVGEAVNNVIEHAYGAAPGTVYLRAHRNGEFLRVEIEDYGHWRAERAENRGGRGLVLMRALAHTVTIATTETGTVVRFDFRVAAGGPDTAPALQMNGSRDPSAPPTVRTAPDPGLADWSVEQAGHFITRSVDGVPVVEVHGDVDLANVEQFTAKLEQAAALTHNVVILSLLDTVYFDSQGMRALLQFGRRLTTNRNSLALVVRPGSPLRRALDLVDVGTIFPTFDSVEQALGAAVAGPPPTPGDIRPGS
jgi:anti-anti-sigma factor